MMMSNETRVIRLNPNGDPERGMTENIPAIDVIEGNSEKRCHRFFVTNRNTMSELRVGVVEGHAYAEKVVDYPCDEICYVMEGSVTITDEDGHVEVFDKGDCLFTPQGFNGIWQQSDKFKKIAMTVCR
jgi:uncharacterized cupin superfamily protein